MDLNIYENEISLAIVHNDDNEVLVVQRIKDANDPTNPVLSWGFPGGKVRPEEHFIDTAKRRTYEETGYIIDSNKEISTRPNSTQTGVVHYCRGVLTIPEQDIIKNDDIVEVKWVFPQQLQEYFSKELDHRIADYLKL